MEEIITVSLDVLLSLSALHTSFHLFKGSPQRITCFHFYLSSPFTLTACMPFMDHRAPSLAFFLLACSSTLAVLPLSSPSLTAAQKDLEWLAEVLGPVLSAFGFLWLSEDRATAHMLLIGSTLLPLLADWLSADGLVIMSRCVGLSALSCSLMVCLFAGNAAGLVGSVALSLPTFLAPRVREVTMGPGMSPKATGVLLQWILKAIMVVGCWTTKTAMNKFLQDLQGWE